MITENDDHGKQQPRTTTNGSTVHLRQRALIALRGQGLPTKTDNNENRQQRKLTTTKTDNDEHYAYSMFRGLATRPTFPLLLSMGV